MGDQKSKEGISVKELEEFAKKHRHEVFFCLTFLFACIFSLIGYFRGGWSIFFAMAGAIIGVLLPMKTEPFLKKLMQFIFKQETTLQLVLGVVALILAIFIPFLIFLVLGLAGGRFLHQMAMDATSK
jgi:hypothetical protein